MEINIINGWKREQKLRLFFFIFRQSREKLYVLPGYLRRSGKRAKNHEAGDAVCKIQ